MRILTFITLILFMSISLTAQSSPDVADIKLETKEDYKNSEELLLQTIDWLLKTPININTSKRKELNAFVLTWIVGSPNVSIELAEGITPGDCPDCLLAFMSGWTKYSLEHDYSKDKIQGALAGIDNAIDFYKRNKSELGKNADLEKLIKLKKKGTLKEYVQSILS